MTQRRPLTEPEAWMYLGHSHYAAVEVAKVLVRLAERHRGRIDGVPQHELAKQAGVSERQVRRLLPALAAVGAVEVVRQPRYTTSSYRVDVERMNEVRRAITSSRRRVA